MARIHALWKVALVTPLLVLSVLGAYLLLVVTGVAQPDAPRKETRSRMLPEGINEADVCTDDHWEESCWMEARNRPGCFVWVARHRQDRLIRWGGECSEGFGEGTGKWIDLERRSLVFFDRLVFKSSAEGLLVQGKKQGAWIGRLRDERAVQESYLDGQRHGVRITHFLNGNTAETRYLLGTPYGYPIRRGPDGVARERNPFAKKTTEEGPVNTDKHGIWRYRDPDDRNLEVVQVDYSRLEAWGLSGSDEPLKETPFPDSRLTGDYALRLAGGTEAEGPIVDGKMQGEWTFRSPSGNVAKGLYADNSRSGDWTEIHRNGTVAKGPYRGALRHGKWEFRYTNGKVREGTYSYNQRMGQWVTRYSNGTVAEGPYHNKKRHGVWVYRYPTGTIWEGSFVAGKKHGEWTRTLPDGTLIEGMFAFGKEYGDWTITHASGNVAKGPYDGGKKTGHWVQTRSDGAVAEGTYVDGKRSGHWIIHFANDDVREGPFVDGRKHGIWTNALFTATSWKDRTRTGNGKGAGSFASKTEKCRKVPM